MNALHFRSVGSGALARSQPAPDFIRFARSWALRIASIVACLWVWQQASTRGWHTIIQFQNVPAPTEVVQATQRILQSPKVLSHVVNSLRRIFLGFSLAAVLAVGSGLVIGRFRLAGDALMLPLEILRPIPAVAWIPLAILMFTSPEYSMVYITFIGAFFPILVNTIHGVQSLDRRLIFASMTLGAGPITVFREVILPGALPSIVTGLSIGMGTSWFSLVTAEMISGQFGIGYYTWEAYTLQNYPDIVVGMIAIGVLGMLSSWLIKQAGAWCMPWLRSGAATV
ncbi:MAG: ABC transporter permease [Verrucomicrobia bacterium]|nr:ABC transporter permease [Verrucomicrobiota bacterium]